MNIDIQIIPHTQQRYPTCGDWWFEQVGDDTVLHIRVSQIPRLHATSDQYGLTIPDRQEMCVAIHEMTEALLCCARGIPQELVDAFDKSPTGRRVNEPGDHPNAPYRREHRAAYVPEMFLLDAFDLDVAAYNKALEAL